MNINIRHADIEDAKAISDLVVAMTDKYVCPTCDPAVRDMLLGSMSTERIEQYLSEGYLYVVALDCAEKVVGVAGIRDYSHLFHLFVDDENQGKGLSRKLWDKVKEAALRNGNCGRFTVNSALNAESVYLRFGFKRIDGIRNRNGMVDIPMILDKAY